jgi:site-specific DNA-methyltransferase (adenine-specific)
MIDLRKGDCLEVMKTIKDNSIDAIITDPPYGTTACKWDSVIDFDLMWEQLNRIIKPNGAIVLFGSEPFSSALRMSNIKNYKYDWVWDKASATNFVHAKNKPMKQHENISIFSLGTTVHKSQSKNRMEYYPQNLIEINKKRKKTATSNVSFAVRPSHKDEFISTHTNYPKTILTFKRDKGKHPTQKPILLMEYLIKTYTNEGETVLDFTMGSGSTLVACQNTNRNGIGIEQDEKYFKIAEQRIKENEFKLF